MAPGRKFVLRPEGDTPIRIDIEVLDTEWGVWQVVDRRVWVEMSDVKTYCRREWGPNSRWRAVRGRHLHSEGVDV